MRTDARLNAQVNEFVFAVECDVSRLASGADRINQDNGVEIGEEGRDAEARRSQILKSDVAGEIEARFQHFDHKGPNTIVAHQHVADAENADATNGGHCLPSLMCK